MNRTTDWYGISSIGTDEYRLTATLNDVPSNAYVLDGDETTLVIDSAFGVGDLRSTVDEPAGADGRLLLTHTHWDHIGAGHQFERVSVHPSEATADNEVRIDSLSDEFVGRPREFVEDHLATGGSLPDGVDPETFAVPAMTDVDPVEPGDGIDLGDRELELVDLAGHSPGQLGVLDREQGVFYAGDLVHGDRNLYVHFRDCDIAQYIESFERAIALHEEGAFSTLLTGHNPPIAGEDLDPRRPPRRPRIDRRWRTDPRINRDGVGRETPISDQGHRDIDQILRVSGDRIAGHVRARSRIHRPVSDLRR